MRISTRAFILSMLCSPFALSALQAPANGKPAPALAPAPPANGKPAQTLTPALPAPSTLLQPSLDEVQHAIVSLRLEKWKKGTVREEATANTSAILRNLEDTLPPLLRDADAAPETIGKMLPVSRNVDALYDVLLRIFEASRVAAPAEQVTELQQALIALGKARGALYDRLQESAAAEDKQLKDLRGALQAQAAVKCPVAPAPAAPACVTPAPARPAKKKPTKPPATTPQATPAPAPATPKS
jgi:hypothetical protein